MIYLTYKLREVLFFMKRNEMVEILKTLQVINDIVESELGVKFDDLSDERKLK